MRSDILYILNHLRDEDKAELTALFGREWKKRTLNRLKKSKITILRNSKSQPFAMGGIEGKKSVACVWLLTTNEFINNKLKLAKEISKQIELASNKFEILYNFIYCSNFQAKKWLKKLGFVFDNPSPKGMKIPDDFEFFYKLTKKEGK